MRTGVLPEEAVTLAEALRENGYRTASFMTNPMLAPTYGLDQGFEVYEVYEIRDLSNLVMEQGLENTDEVVDYFIARFMQVSPGNDSRRRLVEFLTGDLGTSDIVLAQTYMEDSLRLLLHLIMSQPEYQLG